MKKKYREITVDGQVYAWRARYCEGWCKNVLTIWKDKEVIYTTHVDSRSIIKPKYVAEFIKFNNLLVEKNLI